MDHFLEQKGTFFFKSHKIVISVEPRVFYEVDLYTNLTDTAGEYSIIAVLSWIEGEGYGIDLFRNMYSYLKSMANNNRAIIKLEIEPTTLQARYFNEKLKSIFNFNLFRGESEINPSDSCNYLLINPD